MQQRYYAVTRAICPLLITRAMRYCLCTKSTQTTIHDVGANEKGETGSLHTTSRHSKARQSKGKRLLCLLHHTPETIHFHFTSPYTRRRNGTPPHLRIHIPSIHSTAPLPHFRGYFPESYYTHTKSSKKITKKMGGDHKCPVCQATFTRPQHVARHMRSRESSVFLYSFLVGPCKSSLHNEWTHIMEYIRPSITPSAHIRPSPTFRYAGGCAGRPHNPVA
jgi:hypothetical protein